MAIQLFIYVFLAANAFVWIFTFTEDILVFFKFGTICKLITANAKSYFSAFGIMFFLQLVGNLLLRIVKSTQLELIFDVIYLLALPYFFFVFVYLIAKSIDTKFIEELKN